MAPWYNLFLLTVNLDEDALCSVLDSPMEDSTDASMAEEVAGELSTSAEILQN